VYDPCCQAQRAAFQTVVQLQEARPMTLSWRRFVRAIAMVPLLVALGFVGGDVDGLISWWMRSDGGEYSSEERR
jgi:hypothetical protein